MGTCHRGILGAHTDATGRACAAGGNGAKVIQWGGGARQLYYYPKNTIQVTNVGEAVNKSLIEQAGVQAAVPTLGRKQPVYDLGFAADGSVRHAPGAWSGAAVQAAAAGSKGMSGVDGRCFYALLQWSQPQQGFTCIHKLQRHKTSLHKPQTQVDAVVSLQSLAPLPAEQRKKALAEAARVLRPGGVLVFVERVAACERAPASPLRGLLTAGSADGGAALQLAELDALRNSAPSSTVWEGVQFDLALEGQDPFALGVAKRGVGAAPGSRAAAAAQERRRDRKKPSSAKGF